MPVDAQGNRADIIMDPNATVNRMNLGRFYEHHFNGAARDLVNELHRTLGVIKPPMITENHWLEELKANMESLQSANDPRWTQAWHRLMGFYAITSPKTYHWFKEAIYAGKPAHHMAHILQDGIFIYHPPETDHEVTMSSRLLTKHYPDTHGPVTYVGYSGDRVLTKNRVRIASLYIVMLEKTGEDWSAVASGKVQNFGVISQLNSMDKYTNPTRLNPVRALGETELRILASCIGPVAAAEMIDRNNNSFTHRLVVDALLQADKPSFIQNAVDREANPLGNSRPLQLVKHLLYCGGLRFAFKPYEAPPPMKDNEDIYRNALVSIKPGVRFMKPVYGVASAIKGFVSKAIDKVKMAFGVGITPPVQTASAAAPEAPKSTRNLMRIDARKLINVSSKELEDILTGEFTLVFDDGELDTSVWPTIYSSYMWKIHRAYPNAPILMAHHVDTVLKGKRSGSGTHLALLGQVIWSVYDAIVGDASEDEALDLRYDLARLGYEITNELYNGMTYNSEEYVTSLCIEDFIEILDQPEVIAQYEALNKLHADIQAGQYPVTARSEYENAIDKVNDAVTEVLSKKKSLFGNALSKLHRSKLINHGQILQCLSVRGFVTDYDGIQFDTPVLRGYVEGFHLFYDSAIESRSATKSLFFSSTPLQETEYFSRRLQFMAQAVENLHHVDCGATEYVRWTVRPERTNEQDLTVSGDLPLLAGKHYLNASGQLDTITANDTHLIGQTIQLRDTLYCQHPDPVGFCSVCYGKLSDSVPRDSNLGHMNSTFLTQKSSQSVLSVKHRDGSVAIEPIVLGDYERGFLMAHQDGRSYVLSPALKGKSVYLVVHKSAMVDITDVFEVKDVGILRAANVTELEKLGFIVYNGDEIPETPNIEVAMGKRKASMTHALLHYIKNLGDIGEWPMDEKGNYLFDMSKWNFDDPLLVLPLKHFNMADHSEAISELLESTTKEAFNRSMKQPESVLKELFDLVNSRLRVNLAVLSVVLKSVMIIPGTDGKEGREGIKTDYGLPKPWTANGLGVREKTMAGRSAGPMMAYEGHAKYIHSPSSYTETNRPDHVLDAMICPREVVASGNRKL